MGRIESVIFDWGGVLIDDPAPGLMQYCADALGVPRGDYERAHGQFAAEFQKGLIAEEDFWARLCGALRVARPDVPSLWGEAFRSVYSPREEVFSMVVSVRQRGFKTGFLSNTEAAARRYFLELGYDMFDVAVFSCAEGMMKPERRIYEIAVERLGSRPEAAVLIDDRPDYIGGARAAGLNTILFGDLRQVREELARLSVSVD
jgi:putative hydrolase of the HAD superfamily